MYNWSSFQNALPTLQMIESAWQDYQAAISIQELCEGILPEEASSGSQEAAYHLETIKRLSEELPGEVFFWHFPFYKGDFLGLIKALSNSEKPVHTETTQMARDRFRNFMKSIPETDSWSIPGSIQRHRQKRNSIQLLRKLAQAKQSMQDLTINN